MKNDIGKDFKRMAALMQEAIGKRLEDQAMAKAESLVQDAFDKEQYQGQAQAPSKWKQRNKEQQPDRSERRGLLVQSGRLRATIETVMRGRTLVISAGYSVGKWNLAQIHNEGLSPQPERKFMPKPGEAMPELDSHIANFLDTELNKIFK